MTPKERSWFINILKTKTYKNGFKCPYATTHNCHCLTRKYVDFVLGIMVELVEGGKNVPGWGDCTPWDGNNCPKVKVCQHCSDSNCSKCISICKCDCCNRKAPYSNEKFLKNSGIVWSINRKSPYINSKTVMFSAEILSRIEKHRFMISDEEKKEIIKLFLMFIKFENEKYEVDSKTNAERIVTLQNEFCLSKHRKEFVEKLTSIHISISTNIDSNGNLSKEDDIYVAFSEILSELLSDEFKDIQCHIFLQFLRERITDD